MIEMNCLRSSDECHGEVEIYYDSSGGEHEYCIYHANKHTRLMWDDGILITEKYYNEVYNKDGEEYKLARQQWIEQYGTSKETK